MSVEIKIPINGTTLNTKNKYVAEDITITPIVVKYNGEASEDVTPMEDAIVSGTLTEFYNDRVAVIKKHLFRDDITLEKIDCPNVTLISNASFYSCKNLYYINFPNVEQIEMNAFVYCTKLQTTLNFPKLQVLGQFAFGYCDTIETIVLDDIRNIQAGGVGRIPRLKSLIIKYTGGVATLGNPTTFNGTYRISGEVDATYNPDGLKDGYIYVPDQLVDSYKNATNWSAYATQIKPLSELPQEIKDELGME